MSTFGLAAAGGVAWRVRIVVLEFDVVAKFLDFSRVDVFWQNHYPNNDNDNGPRNIIRFGYPIG